MGIGFGNIIFECWLLLWRNIIYLEQKNTTECTLKMKCCFYSRRNNNLFIFVAALVLDTSETVGVFNILSLGRVNFDFVWSLSQGPIRKVQMQTCDLLQSDNLMMSVFFFLECHRWPGRLYYVIGWYMIQSWTFGVPANLTPLDPTSFTLILLTNFTTQQ